MLLIEMALKALRC